ncbi:hypothetical protein [Nonomuraea endophytica]|uniref:hypothetical protein n=1 Tax=Nonomuraea endophytica TaxID=714136 RepID=UPI0037CB6123
MRKRIKRTLVVLATTLATAAALFTANPAPASADPWGWRWCAPSYVILDCVVNQAGSQSGAIEPHNPEGWLYVRYAAVNVASCYLHFWYTDRTTGSERYFGGRWAFPIARSTKITGLNPSRYYDVRVSAVNCTAYVRVQNYT